MRTEQRVADQTRVLGLALTILASSLIMPSRCFAQAPSRSNAQPERKIVVHDSRIIDYSRNPTSDFHTVSLPFNVSLPFLTQGLARLECYIAEIDVYDGDSQKPTVNFEARVLVLDGDRKQLEILKSWMDHQFPSIAMDTFNAGYRLWSDMSEQTRKRVELRLDHLQTPDWSCTFQDFVSSDRLERILSEPPLRMPRLSQDDRSRQLDAYGRIEADVNKRILKELRERLPKNANARPK